jgi:TANFOR domain-containing protein
MLLLCQSAWAQFPVQVNTQLRPPYTLQLSEYYASGREKLVVILTNRDLNKPILNVRLRMIIESQTVQLRTKAYADLPVIALDAGVPVRLSLSDLAPYFNPENMDFSGITRQQYMQQARLPEGFYQFCFEAIEVSSGQVASGKGCAMAWISLSDPPLLNVPRKGEAIAYKEPQNIIFQWTPRHLNSPNSAFQTEYDFQLVELWDTSLAPEIVFQSAAPLYETTTRTTTLLYGPSQPLLIVGKRYGWRVRARARSGIEDVDVFRNQGYSEIYWFTYQDTCPPPAGIAATPGTFGNLEFNWAADRNHRSYVVTYREKGKDDATWFDQKTEQAMALVYDMQPGLVYEYRVGAFCNTDQPTFSEIKTVEVPARNSETFVNCSIVPDPDISNKEPIQNLKVGDIFRAGDFPVKIQEVSGTGTYTGKGYVTVPFLGKAKVSVTFSGIQVNTGYQLIAGEVVTKYGGKGEGIKDIDETLDQFRGYEGLVSRLKGLTITMDSAALSSLTDKVVKEAKEELPSELSNEIRQDVTQLKESKQAYDKANAAYAAATSPEEKEAAKKKRDEAEKTFKKIQEKFEGKSPDAIDSVAYTIDFAQADNAVYGFDRLRYRPYHESNYDAKQKGRQLYYSPWKAVATGSFDLVKAYSTQQGSPLPQDLVFRSTTGALQAQRGANPQEVNVRVHGYGTGDKNEVTAYIRKTGVDGKEVLTEAGSLNVISYSKVIRKLVLVPVNATTLDVSPQEIQSQLNAIYGKAVVQWQVQKDQPFASAYDVDDNGLDDGDSEFLSNYTAEMETLISEYEQKKALEEDTYYLFLVSGSESKTKLGYMPRKKTAGFIYMDLARGGSLIKTIAHELGHGAFRLEHTYKTYASLATGTTDNLMDTRPDGIALHKYQWDLIHDPALVIPILENDEDNELLAQVVQCLTGASLDFSMYYTAIWITMQFDDAIPESNKPAFADFSVITSYKEFSKTEAVVSAGISCAMANLPSFISPNASRKLAAGLAGLGGAATGFATETSKQYEITYNKIKKQGKDPGMTDVITEIDWKPVIQSSAANGLITGTATWIATSPKFKGLLDKIEKRLGITDWVKDKQKVIDYLKARILSNSEALAKYTKLNAKFLSLTPELRKAFGEDFLARADDNLLQAFEKDIALVDAWQVLYKSGQSDAIRTGYNELLHIGKYLNDTKKTIDQVVAEIKEVGGYSTWKNKLLGKVGSIDEAILSVAPYLRDLKDLGISVRKMTPGEADALALMKNSNAIKPEVNIAKAEVAIKNGQSYTSHAASGFPDAKSGNVLTNPIGAINPKKGASVFEPHTSNWEGRNRINDTEVKLLEEFALKNGAVPNAVNQVFAKVEGRIKLYTQLCPCGSCANVIKEFKRMFPGIDLEIVTTTSKSFR